jgi:hypothetical protein
MYIVYLAFGESTSLSTAGGPGGGCTVVHETDPFPERRPGSETSPAAELGCEL